MLGSISFIEDYCMGKLQEYSKKPKIRIILHPVKDIFQKTKLVRNCFVPLGLRCEYFVRLLHTIYSHLFRVSLLFRTIFKGC